MRPVDPIEEALERLAPSFDHDLPFWEDVLLRVRGADTELGRRVRPLVIALAAVLVVAVTGTAFALERYVFVGKPAPPAVKKEFSRMNEPTRGLLLPERHRPPGVLGARARAAAVIEASTGPVYLWVAPTRSGGYCEFLEIVGNGRPDGRGNGGGNCTPKDNRLYATHRGTRVRGRFVQFVHGQTPRAARRVELRFPNGSVRKVPVRRRFFLAEIHGRIPPAGQAGPRFTLVALTSDGRVVGRQRDTGAEHQLATLQLHRDVGYLGAVHPPHPSLQSGVTGDHLRCTGSYRRERQHVGDAREHAAISPPARPCAVAWRPSGEGSDR